MKNDAAEERNKVLQNRIVQLQKLNEELFERAHKAEKRIMLLEEENAYLRSSK